MQSREPAMGQSRYGMLAGALRERVMQGEWVPGEVIPAESALARAYVVALGTMRQALALLVENGVLQRRHGKGTIVSKGMDSASMMRFFRFSAADGEVQVPRSSILSMRRRSAALKEQRAFGLDRAGQVLQFQRLRSLGEHPCLLETIVLPLPLFEALARTNSAQWDDLLYPMYQKRCGVLIQRAEDDLGVARLNVSQARRLKLAAEHPCVVVERAAFDLAGRCVELRTTRGDAFAFTYAAQVR